MNCTKTQHYCSFPQAPNIHVKQYWRRCFNCHASEQGACLSCCVVCHDGHTMGPLQYGEFFCDCPSSQKCKLYVTKPPVPALTQDINVGVNRLGIELFSKLGNDKVFSPLSIGFLLSLVHQGSRNKTSDELTSVMGIKYDLEQMKKMYANFNIHCVKVSNMILINNNFASSINAEYTNSVKDISVCRTENFKHANEIVEYVNRYVETNTNGLIKNALSTGSIVPDDALLLVNTIYFKCNWEDRFDIDDTRHNINFTSDVDGTIHKVSLMKRKDRYSYYSAPTYHMVEIPYEDKDFAMGLVMSKNPILTKGADVYREVLMIFASHIDKLKRTSVVLSLPRFTQRSKFNMIPCLQQIGISTLFDSHDCDLSKIISNPVVGNLYISKAFQEAVVIVDEKGTESAAFNGMMAVAACVAPHPVEFRADRSFMYYIRHKPSNIILFVGEFNGN